MLSGTGNQKNTPCKCFKEDKGYFWKLIETRLYMRSKTGLADCLYVKREIDRQLKFMKKSRGKPQKFKELYVVK